ncbi:MAG: Xanthine/uracil/vitamin permease [Bacilli bacterium]|nr:Xanthine/uracil/vitamin permease [Bacilli bacterium]
MIAKYFQFEARNTNFRREVIGGLTTFLTMAYILVVNPGIISQTGMDLNSVFLATAISAAVATLLMGLFANYPLALAPGMGLNAYFTFAVVMGLKVPWQTALGAVFISGVLFFILTLTKIRELVVNSIPANLKHAISAGIGLFIAFIGLQDSKIIVGDKATLVALGNFHDPNVILSLVGLLVIFALMVRKIRGGILIGIVVTAIVGMIFGLVPFPTGIVSAPPSLAPTFLKLNLGAALHQGFILIIFAFFFVDFFDNTGTLVGVANKAGLIKDGKLPNASRVFITDSISTMFGSLLGTSTVTSYIESAAGVAEGARTGFANVIVAILFLLSIFFSPIISVIATSPAVTAPVLIVVGSLMITSLANIDWSDMTDAVPAFLTILLMPLTYSIATGIAIGFTAYPILKLIVGKGRQVHPVMYILAVLFILRFIFL